MKTTAPTRLVVSLLVCLSILVSCGKRDNDQPTPTVTTTTISGVVLAQDEVLQPISKAGALVTLEGTEIKATTDANGTYRLEKVPLGQHVLNVSRAGMGTMRYEADVKNLDAVMFPTITLDQQTSTQVKSLDFVGKTMYSLPDEVAAYQCSITYNPQLYPAPKLYSIMVYVGKNDKVSNASYLGATQISESENTPAPTVRGVAKMRIAFYQSSLKQLGFASGDKVYLAVYGAPKNVSDGGIGNEAYYIEPYSLDPVTKRVQQVRANLNPNPVKVSFTMP
ncbi:carboxypeptidase regulatory-like domain-containing protein [Hymenobacter crusticola]|uniref:Carboxypeptidase regulatory-like domain-containing protein n=1 Tax=Hymenobacter crusticola TaxID=1770526 RepID=A0A243WDC0_9BACT|nr:carboxypeptidase regulatory-like domain-containing protein [Hymenobacter crusticola]OUJ73666.1 hypothetical protein BXP70_11790 [Hymenobacter crusticola]